MLAKQASKFARVFKPQIHTRSFTATTASSEPHPQPSLNSALHAYPSNTLISWGTGDDGQLGQSTVVKSGLSNSYVELSPKPVNDAPIFEHIAAGHSHAAGLTKDGVLYTWGNATYGKLGHENVTVKSQNGNLCLLPSKVDTDRKFKRVCAGELHTAALTDLGELYTCGWAGSTWSGQGALGIDFQNLKVAERRLLEKVWIGGEAYDVRLKEIASGKKHMLGLGIGGEVYSWGKGEWGRLGNGGAVSQVVPMPIEYFLELDIEVEKISAGGNFSLALDVNGQVYSWGSNSKGQLGLGGGFSMDFFTMESIPREVEFKFHESDDRIIDIAAGDTHAVAVTQKGAVYMWGLGIYLEPHRVTPLEKQHCISVSCGNSFSVVLNDIGQMFSWGDGMIMRKGGALGLGHTKTTKQPELITSMKHHPVRKVNCGERFVLALTGEP